MQNSIHLDYKKDELVEEVMCNVHGDVQKEYTEVENVVKIEGTIINLEHVKQELSPIAYQEESDDNSQINNCLEKDGENMKNLKCSQCNYETTCDTFMETHLKTMHGNNAETGYKLHIPTKDVQKSEPQRKYNYTQCLHRTNYKCNLSCHVIKHTEEIKKFGCILCSFRSSCRFDVQEHFKEHKSKLQTFPTKTTNEKLQLYRKSLGAHIVNKYTGSIVGMYKCKECPYIGTRNHLISHKRNKHAIQTTKDIKCALCSYETSYGNNLQLHMKYKHGTEVKTDD